MPSISYKNYSLAQVRITFLMVSWLLPVVFLNTSCVYSQRGSRDFACWKKWLRATFYWMRNKRPSSPFSPSSLSFLIFFFGLSFFGEGCWKCKSSSSSWVCDWAPAAQRCKSPGTAQALQWLGPQSDNLMVVLAQLVFHSASYIHHSCLGWVGGARTGAHCSRTAMGRLDDQLAKVPLGKLRENQGRTGENLGSWFSKGS